MSSSVCANSHPRCHRRRRLYIIFHHALCCALRALSTEWADCLKKLEMCASGLNSKCCCGILLAKHTLLGEAISAFVVGVCSRIDTIEWIYYVVCIKSREIRIDLRVIPQRLLHYRCIESACFGCSTCLTAIRLQMRAPPTKHRRQRRHYRARALL